MDYEFRTTVVKEYHTIDDIGKIGKMIEGAPRYFLQKFVDSGMLIGTDLHEVSREEMLLLEAEAQKYVPGTRVRGMD